MRLKEIREELNISQKEFAKKLNVSPTNIYNYENGRTEPSIEILIQICNLLNVTADYLIGRTDDFGVVTREDGALSLSGNERDLLSSFRKLDMVNQNKVIGYCYALAH